jgi:hypothetical protein
MTTTRVADSPSPTNGRRLPLKALAALFFLTLSGLVLLAACGGDDEEESTATPSGTGAPAATQTTTGTQAPAETASPAAEETATTAPQASGGEIDPCALLTKAEVEAAIGASVTEPEAEQVANLVACSYNDPETPIFSLVSVTVFIGENADQASDVYELTKDNAADAQSVGGIGNDAFWDSVLNGLEILEGKYDIRVDVSPDGWDARAVAEDLAAKVVDRLP